MPRAELRAGGEALGQLEVVADIEELNRVLVVFGKSEERMGPRGDDPAAQQMVVGRRILQSPNRRTARQISFQSRFT